MSEIIKARVYEFLCEKKAGGNNGSGDALDVKGNDDGESGD